MKLESLVIVHHKGTVNVPTSLVHTARHAMEVGGSSGFFKTLKFLKLYANFRSCLPLRFFGLISPVCHWRLRRSRNTVAVGEPVAGLDVTKIFDVTELVDVVLSKRIFYGFKSHRQLIE
jgi:hypothetical protein